MKYSSDINLMYIRNNHVVMKYPYDYVLLIIYMYMYMYIHYYIYDDIIFKQLFHRKIYSCRQLNISEES